MNMTDRDSDKIWEGMKQSFMEDTWSADEDALKEGYPIDYRDDRYPDPQHRIKNYPDGGKQLVTLDDDWNDVVVKDVL